VSSVHIFSFKCLLACFKKVKNNSLTLLELHVNYSCSHSSNMSKTFITVLLVTSPQEDEYVCRISVSQTPSISETTRPNFTKLLYRGRCYSDLLWRFCDMLRTYSFVNSVVFPHHVPYGTSCVFPPTAEAKYVHSTSNQSVHWTCFAHFQRWYRGYGDWNRPGLSC